MSNMSCKIFFFSMSLLLTISSRAEFKENFEFCYGVYHESKSNEEVKKHDLTIQRFPSYRNLFSSDLFQKGKGEVKRISQNEKSKCYELVYTFLADLLPEHKKLIKSKPYCFGYLKKAQEKDYIPDACSKKCLTLKKKNCQRWCVNSLNKNLKKERIDQGNKDAQFVDPLQFVTCINEVNDL